MRIRRRELAGEFAERVCSRERLPYTLAIHRGGANGENPHAHLMFSERIDGRSLADLRDEAYRAGDLERAADFSREPNVHLGPERYRTIRGGASETVKQAGQTRETVHCLTRR